MLLDDKQKLEIPCIINGIKLKSFFTILIILFINVDSIVSQYRPKWPSPILQREIFVLNLEDGYFACQINDSTDFLQLFELSKLCDDKPHCFKGSDELKAELKCIDRNQCHPKQPKCTNGVCLDNLCYCNDGFGGKGCDLPDENECKYRPCDVFAHCTNTLGSFYCTCTPGYDGDGFTCYDVNECEDPVLSKYCVKNAECCNLPGHFVCKCKEGFAGNGTQSCTDIDECLKPESCGRGALCINNLGSFECQCPEGFTGDPQIECWDIDECKSNPCNNGTCHNLPGSYSCTCLPGYIGNPKPENGCVDIDECVNSFYNPCGTGSICTNRLGSFDCQCPRGFTGDPRTGCIDIDECEMNSCGANTICENSMGDYTCKCKKGYSGDPYLSSGCLDINECISNDICAPQNAECINTEGGYECKCRFGYTGNPMQECLDIDECEMNPCGPGAICINYEGSSPGFQCKCPEKYVAKSNSPELGCDKMECETDNDCLGNARCLNSFCYCPPPYLADNGCTCPPNYINDSYVGCLSREETKISYAECTDKIVCPPDTVCYRGLCSRKNSCFANGDCPIDSVCRLINENVGKQCVDPCDQVQCGPNSYCETVDHRPACHCNTSYSGNPNDLIFGCSPKGPPPFMTYCDSESDCDHKSVCKPNFAGAKICVDICDHTQCGPNAFCRSINKKAECLCANRHFTGNPYDLEQGCTIPASAHLCTNDEDCSIEKSCILTLEGVRNCVDVCKHHQCSEGSKCVVRNHKTLCECLPGFARVSSPGPNGTIIGICEAHLCDSDNECKHDEHCILNNRGLLDCVPVCAEMICGENSECISIAHQANCICKSGYEGNAMDLIKGCQPIAYSACEGCKVREPRRCISSPDCGDAQECIDGQCRFLCIKDAECIIGERCLDGFCVPLGPEIIINIPPRNQNNEDRYIEYREKHIIPSTAIPFVPSNQKIIQPDLRPSSLPHLKTYISIKKQPIGHPSIKEDHNLNQLPKIEQPINSNIWPDINRFDSSKSQINKSQSIRPELSKPSLNERIDVIMKIKDTDKSQIPGKIDDINHLKTENLDHENAHETEPLYEPDKKTKEEIPDSLRDMSEIEKSKFSDKTGSQESTQGKSGIKIGVDSHMDQNVYNQTKYKPESDKTRESMGETKPDLNQKTMEYKKPFSKNNLEKITPLKHQKHPASDDKMSSLSINYKNKTYLPSIIEDKIPNIPNNSVVDLYKSKDKSQIPDFSQLDPSKPYIKKTDLHKPDLSDSNFDRSNTIKLDINKVDKTEPDMSRPDISEPELKRSDISKTDLVQPDLSKDDINRPDLTKPEYQRPDFTRPDLSKDNKIGQDSLKHDISKVDKTKTDSNRFNISELELRRPDFGEIDFTRPDSSKDNINRPDLTRPDLTRPDLSKDDINRPDFRRPDLTKDDINRPDFRRPDLSKDDINRPDFRRPDLSKDNINRPDFTKPDKKKNDLNRFYLNKTDKQVMNKIDPIRSDLSKFDIGEPGSKKPGVSTFNTSKINLSKLDSDKIYPDKIDWTQRQKPNIKEYDSNKTNNSELNFIGLDKLHSNYDKPKVPHIMHTTESSYIDVIHSFTDKKKPLHPEIILPDNKLYIPTTESFIDSEIHPTITNDQPDHQIGHDYNPLEYLSPDPEMPIINTSEQIGKPDLTSFKQQKDNDFKSKIEENNYQKPVSIKSDPNWPSFIKQSQKPMKNNQIVTVVKDEIKPLEPVHPKHHLENIQPITTPEPTQIEVTKFRKPISSKEKIKYSISSKPNITRPETYTRNPFDSAFVPTRPFTVLKQNNQQTTLQSSGTSPTIKPISSKPSTSKPIDYNRLNVQDSTTKQPDVISLPLDKKQGQTTTKNIAKQPNQHAEIDTGINNQVKKIGAFDHGKPEGSKPYDSGHSIISKEHSSTSSRPISSTSEKSIIPEAEIKKLTSDKPDFRKITVDQTSKTSSDGLRQQSTDNKIASTKTTVHQLIDQITSEPTIRKSTTPDRIRITEVKHSSMQDISSRSPGIKTYTSLPPIDYRSVQTQPSQYKVKPIDISSTLSDSSTLSKNNQTNLATEERCIDNYCVPLFNGQMLQVPIGNKTIVHQSYSNDKSYISARPMITISTTETTMHGGSYKSSNESPTIDHPISIETDKDINIQICIGGICRDKTMICQEDNDCPSDRTCDLESKQCISPCYVCGSNSECSAVDHRAVCICPKNTIGDAFDKEVGCFPPETTDPSTERTIPPVSHINVMCQSDGIQVGVKLGGYDGIVYVKGYSQDYECRRSVRSDERDVIDFKVIFGQCGLFHSNGEASFILVVQKHPKLVTYRARAYHIKCLYNTGERIVTLGFNVSMITTSGTIANTGPPPTCTLSICTLDGNEVSSAEIGDDLLLKVNVQPDFIYGGFARSCIAKTMEEEGEFQYEVTDANGCATDSAIFGNWEYDENKKSLVARFNAFKFPSSNNLRFQCNIRICFNNCPTVNCDDSEAYGRRRRRELEPTDENDHSMTLTNSLGLDTYKEGQLREEIQVQSNAILTFEKREQSYEPFGQQRSEDELDHVCLPKLGLVLSMIITTLLAIVAVAVAISCWLMAYRRKVNHIHRPLSHSNELPNTFHFTPEPTLPVEPIPDYYT